MGNAKARPAARETLELVTKFSEQNIQGPQLPKRSDWFGLGTSEVSVMIAWLYSFVGDSNAETYGGERVVEQNCLGC